MRSLLFATILPSLLLCKGVQAENFTKLPNLSEHPNGDGSVLARLWNLEEDPPNTMMPKLRTSQDHEDRTESTQIRSMAYSFSDSPTKSATSSRSSSISNQTVNRVASTSVSTSNFSATATTGYFVTQDPLAVKDNSPDTIPKVKEFLTNEEYEHLIGIKQELSVSVFHGKEAYIERVQKDGQPFLYTGKVSSRTRKNCYVVRARDDLSTSELQRLKNVLGATGTIRHTYKLRGLKGFSICFPDDFLPIALLKSLQGVKWIERDQFVKLQQVQENPPWQLSKLNEPVDTAKSYNFNSTGQGVNVYVIDSGVMTDHPEFGGRAKVGYTIFGAGFPNDCAGHGTQVSSVVAGTNVGVAKLANIIGCQVLDCDGQADNSNILGALTWIVNNHQKPAVINMSVGGPKSPAVDDAVRAAISSGIPVVVAAGNSQIDACVLSPSGVMEAMVVGAYTIDMARAAFSNYGSCVDIFAPGKRVIAAALPNQATKNGFAYVSGTSLSAPLVTGIYALLLQANPQLSPAELQAKVIEMAELGVLDENSLLGSVNLVARTPELPHIASPSIKFLPKGVLPSLGLPSTAPNTVELVLIIVAAATTLIFLLVIAFVVIRRILRKRKEEERLKSSTSL